MATRKRTGRPNRTRTGNKPGRPRDSHRIRVRHPARIKRIKKLRTTRISGRHLKEAKKLIAKTRKLVAKSTGTRKLPKIRLFRKRLSPQTRKRVQSKRRRYRSRRRMLTFSNAQRYLVVLSRRMASMNGHYLNAVRRLLHTNDPSALKEFAGASIKDIYGREFIFEVRINVLYRLNSVPEPIAEIYQVVA